MANSVCSKAKYASSILKVSSNNNFEKMSKKGNNFPLHMEPKSVNGRMLAKISNGCHFVGVKGWYLSRGSGNLLQEIVQWEENICLLPSCHTSKPRKQSCVCVKLTRSSGGPKSLFMCFFFVFVFGVDLYFHATQAPDVAVHLVAID